MARPKGVPNRKTTELQEIAERIGVNPFEILCLFAKEDWKGLGYEKATYTKVFQDGGTMEIERISPELRFQAAKEASKYLFPQRKAVELSTQDDAGFKIIVEDYLSKGEKKK